MSFERPNYLPTEDPGDTRFRIWRIGGENPLAGSPSMTFHEQEVIKTSDGSEKILNGYTRRMKTNYDPAKVVLIRNPVTDQPGAVGRVPESLTLAEAYAVLYSLGRDAQYAQDDADEAAYDAEHASSSSSSSADD